MRQWWALGAMVAAVLLVVAACSDAGTPATTPVVTTLPETTTTMPATTTTAFATTSTTSATTTTVAPTTTVDRVAEVQAIIQGLEERRLEALFREDEEAFRALFANDAYLERSLEVLGTLEFVAEPQNVIVEVREVLADTDHCLALEVEFDYSQALGPTAVSDQTVVLEWKQEEWGYSYAGTGWTCDGPHPFDT